jgi:mannitol/fructose-specific phosphotransferase system IIA component (Ntr-type)
VLLSQLLAAERVKVPLGGRTKDEVLRELVELIAGEAGPGEVEAILASVNERERRMTTGIGDGIAIPHGKTSLVDSLVVAAGVARWPIDYDSLDGQPVRLFFLLLGPGTANTAHVKALSQISRLLRRDSVRGELVAAPSAGEFLRIVQASENA